MRKVIRLVAAAQAVALGVAGAVLTSSAPAAALPVAGTVITSATVTVPAEYASLATAKKITYVTSAPNGVLLTTSGLVFTPKTNKQNKTVVWAHGTTGLADKCAPSNNNDVFWPEAKAAITVLLQRGWTVAAPDYAGLGTPGSHPYLIGASEGRAIIDSAKAARNLDSALSTQYAIDGHSQGGQGALFANQLAPSYDGALVLKGTAAIAPVSNLNLIAPVIPGSPGQGYLVMALYGINAIEPTFNPNTYLAAPAKAKASVLSSGCLMEILDAYAPLTPEQLVPNGVVPQIVLDKLAQYGNPATSAPSAPILIVQGTDDEAVPYDITAGPLVDELSTYGAPEQFVSVSGASHDGAVFATTTSVADWIGTHFA
ncbi:lipase family protein [Actinoplanes sp. N902-109]|uniref:lipase family protein n=1 Tax=Actinoplanes sp. (strain N902-109) TaxID=649831 RepID=UPI000329456C|nr:lipase family protein [Actinoplanes sp. N902-109]AGL18857.1 secretory lipase [Actinoplanes sp. N902-109]